MKKLKIVTWINEINELELTDIEDFARASQGRRMTYVTPEGLLGITALVIYEGEGTPNEIEAEFVKEWQS